MVLKLYIKVDHEKSYTDCEIKDNEVVLKLHIPYEIK